MKLPLWVSALALAVLFAVSPAGAATIDLGLIVANGLSDFVGNLSLWLFNPYERIFPTRIRFAVEDIPETPQGIVEQLSALTGDGIDRFWDSVSQFRRLGSDVQRLPRLLRCHECESSLTECIVAQRCF